MVDLYTKALQRIMLFRWYVVPFSASRSKVVVGFQTYIESTALALVSKVEAKGR